MDEKSKVITVLVSIAMGLIVVIGATKNKYKRQNDILNRAIRKTEYQSISCYCVDTLTDRKITNATFFQRSTCAKKYKCKANASKDCNSKQNNEWEKCLY